MDNQMDGESIVKELHESYCPFCSSKYIGYDLIKRIWDCEECKRVFKNPLRIEEEESN